MDSDVKVAGAFAICGCVNVRPTLLLAICGEQRATIEDARKDQQRLTHNMAQQIVQTQLFDDAEQFDSGATFSPCRSFRYALWRHWEWLGHANCVMFVGLNPSKADELKNDTTISKCIGFAKRWGYGGIYMLNLYAYCATDPGEMVRASDPVGPGNDEALAYYRSRVGLIVGAWGDAVPLRFRPVVRFKSRIKEVMDCLGGQPIHCLGRTQSGEPRHPSRLAYETKLEPLVV